MLRMCVKENPFDIEIDSGAEVSCLLVNIGADTNLLHEMGLSLCGGHHVAAGGGKLHELALAKHSSQLKV